MKMPTLMATLVTVLGAVRSATAQIPPACGYVVEQTCPGCTPSAPGDSTCSCGVVDSSCSCKKTSGGVQTGQIVTCEVKYFGVVGDENGYEIEEADDHALCATIKQCVTPSGYQTCGSYVEGPPPGCDVPINDRCGWRITTQTYTSTYSEGDRCQGG